MENSIIKEVKTKNVMISLVFLFLFQLHNIPLYAQDWELFLDRYIDNIHHADTVSGLSALYTDEAIAQKKSQLLVNIHNAGKSNFQNATGHNNPNLYPIHTIFSKEQMSALNATLNIGSSTEKNNARNRLYNTMLNHGYNGAGAGTDFISSYVSYLLHLKPEVFTETKETDLRDYFAENSGNIWGRHFWEYNTENHAQMYRVTTYGVGLKWPDHSFIANTDNSRKTGTYMYQQIENNHIKKYIQYLYKYSNGENLSPVYLSHHITPLTTFYDLAKKHGRFSAMDAVSGILEYNYALAGLNSYHKLYAGTINRVHSKLNMNYNFNGISRIMGGFTPGESPGGASSIVAESSFIPHPKTRALIAGDIRMPFTLLQSCAKNGWYQNQVRLDDRNPNLIFDDAYAKTVFRYVYNHRQYVLGTGNIKCLPGDKIDYPDGIAGSAGWQGGFMVLSSPQVHITEKWGDKFFEDFRPGYSGNVEKDSWVGYSPYMEMAQFENTAIVYCIIPPHETHKIAQVHFTVPKAYGGEEMVTIESNQAWYFKYRAKDGFVYIGIIPLHYTSLNHQMSGFLNTERIVDDGASDDGHCGYVFEMGHSSEGTFTEFKNRVNASQLSWNKTSGKITYTNRLGHTLSLTHSNMTLRSDKLPDIEITPFGQLSTIIDWESYPALRSPYLKVISEDGREKLVINDNEGGVKVDFDGENIHYTDCYDYLPDNILSEYQDDFGSFNVRFQFMEEKTGEFIENAEIIFNEISYTTEEDGIIDLNGVEYGSYSIQFDNPGYGLFKRNNLEIFSDTVLTFLIPDKNPLLSLLVTDFSTGSPVYRAIITYKGSIYYTNTSGIINLGEIETNEISFVLSHSKYFDYDGLIEVVSDSTVNIRLIPKMANVSFLVTSGSLFLSGINVRFATWNTYTNSEGMAFFFQQPARMQYNVELSGYGYDSFRDSFFIERDTIIHINLELATGKEQDSDRQPFVFPCPASGFVNISLPELQGNVKLIDLTGKTIFNKYQIEFPAQVNLENVKKGMYILEISSSRKIYRHRLIIQ